MNAQTIFGIDRLTESVSLWDLNRNVLTLSQVLPAFLGLAKAAQVGSAGSTLPPGGALCLLHLSEPSLSPRNPSPWCSELCFRVWVSRFCDICFLSVSLVPHFHLQQSKIRWHHWEDIHPEKSHPSSNTHSNCSYLSWRQHPTCKERRGGERIAPGGSAYTWLSATSFAEGSTGPSSLEAPFQLHEARVAFPFGFRDPNIHSRATYNGWGCVTIFSLISNCKKAANCIIIRNIPSPTYINNTSRDVCGSTCAAMHTDINLYQQTKTTTTKN